MELPVGALMFVVPLTAALICSPDLVWLLKEGKGDARPLYGRRSASRRRRGVPGTEAERHGAVDREPPNRDCGRHARRLRRRLFINPRWLDPDVTREQVVEGLSPLLELPVKHVLATHGGPFERTALERALA